MTLTMYYNKRKTHSSFFISIRKRVRTRIRKMNNFQYCSLISNMYISVFDATLPSEWGEKGKHGGLVAAVANSLGIGSGSYGTVQRVMEKTYEAVSGGFGVDLSRAPRKNVTQYKIKIGSKYEIMVCKHLEEGNTPRLTANIISMQMLVDGIKESVSVTAVKSVIACLNPITNVIKVRGQWSDNHEAWVIARYNWVLHLLVRIGYHEHEVVVKHIATFVPLPDWLNRKKLEEGNHCQIAWFNKTHLKVLLGHLGTMQYRFKWLDGKPVQNDSNTYDDLKSGANENELAPMMDEERQEMHETYLHQDWHTTPDNICAHYNEEKFRYKFNFEQESRFMLGVMMIETMEGERKGI